jgi:hypothetical protein
MIKIAAFGIKARSSRMPFGFQLLPQFQIWAFSREMTLSEVTFLLSLQDT